VVLGGDIFDFRWSTLSSLNESIDNSILWLNELISPHDHCVFHYLLGNHDAHPHFVAELDRLAFEHPNLFWHPYVLRLGDCMFLHGDILDSTLSHEALDERRRFLDEVPPPGRMSHLLYDVVVKTRLHRVAIHMTKRRLTILRKLTQYLQLLGHGHDSGVRHVYFGHTHRDMDGIEHRGLTFHNGGASIKGLGFRILEARVDLESSRTFESHPGSHGTRQRKRDQRRS
jgi:UDP-2,3-diacylglucosamine hydrolase